jgi:DNA mismatch endonuclease (patch repair protein)
MVDHVDRAKRSMIMRAVRSTHTGPELIVRRLLHKAGYRYRLHGSDLPGRPDLIFPARHKIVFVHGCFWHGHRGCSKARLPKTRVSFWSNKIALNRQRDASTIRQLKRQGWRSLVVWQCQLRRPERVLQRLVRFLEE